ncbi:unnamed protein product [Periconia digitata]|uniref:Uncharacterized protein n=1 Tax=Periconia digitata TaxID=1303443 RepID=A0A9W4XVL6_9PLEO|nr:unnamed protein product [Periconia digitata]
MHTHVRSTVQDRPQRLEVVGSDFLSRTQVKNTGSYFCRLRGLSWYVPFTRKLAKLTLSVPLPKPQ